MKLADEIAAAGYKGTLDQFKNHILRLKEDLFPKWTDEDLLRSPREALRYCNAVRYDIRCDGLSDDLITGALLGIRKNGRGRARGNGDR